MKLKYDENWLFKSELGFGTYIHIVKDNVLVSNRIAHVKTKTYRITLKRINHLKIYFYKFDCSLCYDDVGNVSITTEELNSTILEVLKLFVDELDTNSVVSFVAELTDKESIKLYEYLVKSNNYLSLSTKDFSTLNIPIDNKYKFFGLSKNKNIMKELTKIKIENQQSFLSKIMNLFRKQNV